MAMWSKPTERVLITFRLGPARGIDNKRENVSETHIYIYLH
jgi:hypothetical protein